MNFRSYVHEFAYVSYGHVRRYARTDVHMYVRTYVYIYVHVFVYVRMYVTANQFYLYAN